MKRTTVFLEEALVRRARQLAARQGRSFAAVVREALAQYLGGPRPGPRTLPSVTGMFDSGHEDTSERVDELLWRDPHG